MKHKHKNKNTGVEKALRMKISKKLPQFKNQNVLIIVAGKLGAAFYRATKGVLDRMLVFKAGKPEFSDNGRENFIKKRGSNPVSGFIKTMKNKLKEAHSFSFSKIFIFAPGQTKNKIAEALPPDWRKQAHLVGDGNYFNSHPFFILEKIKNYVK